jgi:hypothetical protein
VTIAEWIERRASGVPRTLTTEVVAALGADARLNDTDTARACLAAAARVLAALLRDRSFGRDSAGRLLAADALTTYAFEYASEAHLSAPELTALATRAAGQIGSLPTTP